MLRPYFLERVRTRTFEVFAWCRSVCAEIAEFLSSAFCSGNFWVPFREPDARARTEKCFFSEIRPSFLTASVSALQTLCTLSHLNMSTHRCGKHPQVRIQNRPHIGVGETLCKSWASNSACNLTTRISCSKPRIWEFFKAKLCIFGDDL